MRKNSFKKLLSLALVVTLGFTLGSCGTSAYSTEAPYGDITGNYATNDGHTLTNKQLYDLLRPNGYSVLYSQIEEILLTNHVNENGDTTNYLNLDYNDDFDDMQQLLLETLFSVDNMDDFNDISDDTFNEFVEQFIDSMYAMNIVITSADFGRDSDGLKFSETIFDYFKLNLAKENYSRDRLVELIAKGEEYEEDVYDEDGELEYDSNGDVVTETVTNNYYISDEDIENYYNSTYRHNQDYHAVIAGFNTLAEYEAAVSSAKYYNSSSSNTNTFYAQLYNNAYTYKNKFTITSSSMTSDALIDDKSLVNADKLAAFNSDLASFVVNMDEGTCTKTYKEFGGKYYMVYKLTNTTSDKWEDLTSAQQESLYDEVYDELFETKLSSSFTSTQISNIIKELIEDEAIEIFDPVFAVIFDNNFTDYTYEAQSLENKNSVLTFTYNEDEHTITPDELYETLASYYGVSTAVSYFTNYAIANSELADNLDSDDEDAAQEAFDAAIENFENNAYLSSGITSEFSEDEFLLMMYGYDNETDVVNNYFMAQQAIAYLAEDYSDLYFELLELTGINNYEYYFDLTIKHVLLYVDYDLDGTLDNPEEFMQQLAKEDNGTTKVAAFEAIITNIYSEIYKEAEYLSGSMSDNLDKIVRMYNDGDKISYRAGSLLTNYTWDQIKTGSGTSYSYDFNIQIKVEELGAINNSNASSYVTEFSDHVEAMYNDLYEANKTIFDENISKYQDDELNLSTDYIADLLDSLDEYLDDEHLEKIVYGDTSFDDLCMSSFGFHMLLSTDGGVASNAVFTVDDDRKADSEDEFYIYQNIVVTYNDEEMTFDGYSDTAWPSMDQLKVYVYESNSDDGVESLKSTTESIINEFYSTFTTRYTDSTFVSYLIYTMLDMDIQFEHESVTELSEDLMANWFEISRKQLDNYDTTASSYTGWWEAVAAYYADAE